MAQCHKRAFVTQPARATHPPTHPHGPLPELTRSWSENRPAWASPPAQAWQDSTSQCQRSSTHTVHFSAAACRADLRTVGDRGPPLDGMEARSLPEDFDTPTATGKPSAAMVLAFSEWWRNSIKERSVAGQAKVRTGLFPWPTAEP